MARQKNPVTEKETKKTEEQDMPITLYTEEDFKYRNFLRQRLTDAKKAKEQMYPEFNNKTYYQYYEENEKIANTHHLDPKKNPDDVVVSAGTVESKLDSLLSNINNLNLEAEVFAFDKENSRIVEIGIALEDIMHDCKIRDGADGGGDDEKRMSRQRELMKQGTVFVQQEWLKKWETKKKLNKKFDGKFKQDANFFSSNLELVFDGPSRTLLHGPNVFLGDITKFYMDEQPYIFVVIRTTYDIAKTKYGKFENFKYVKAGPAISADTDTGANTLFDNKWRLSNDLAADQVEIILYQDQPGDEFQIQINDVMLLPIGFPLSAVSPRGKYNVAKQVFRIINDKFAYGGSFVSSGSVKEISALIDEMLKLFVIKTRASARPAYINMSGRVIDRKVLSPGRISMGLEPGALVPITGTEQQNGITAGESNFLEKMQTLIDKSTVSDQFQGQQSGRQMTATESLDMQRQAKLSLGLTIATCMLLEQKLDYLLLYTILENWFEPQDSRVKEIEGARKLLKSYRKTTRTTNIDGAGLGERSVIPVDGELPSPEVIRGMEREQEEIRGMPIRRIYIEPNEMLAAGLSWYIVINAQEKESSPFFKSMMREMLTDMLTLTQFGSVPNKDGIEEEFSRVWKTPRQKLFSSVPVDPTAAGVGGDSMTPKPKGQSGQAMSPGALSGVQ